MSEEEIIKECTELAKDEYQQLYGCWDIERAEQAIQGLLDLYQKEKEKNEKIENKIKEKLKTFRYLDEENIKNKDNMEYEECFNKSVLYTRIIWLLQELLEERN